VCSVVRGPLSPIDEWEFGDRRLEIQGEGRQRTTDDRRLPMRSIS